MTPCEVCGWPRIDKDKLCLVFEYEPILHLMLAGRIAMEAKERLG